MKKFRFVPIIIGISIITCAGLIGNVVANDRDEVQAFAANDSRGAKDNNNSVLICHRTNGKNGYFELWVPEAAVPGHLGHGDDLGGCGLIPDIPT